MKHRNTVLNQAFKKKITVSTSWTSQGVIYNSLIKSYESLTPELYFYQSKVLEKKIQRSNRDERIETNKFIYNTVRSIHTLHTSHH